MCVHNWLDGKVKRMKNSFIFYLFFLFFERELFYLVDERSKKLENIIYINLL